MLGLTPFVFHPMWEATNDREQTPKQPPLLCLHRCGKPTNDGEQTHIHSSVRPTHRCGKPTNDGEQTPTDTGIIPMQDAGSPQMMENTHTLCSCVGRVMGFFLIFLYRFPDCVCVVPDSLIQHPHSSLLTFSTKETHAASGGYSTFL